MDKIIKFNYDINKYEKGAYKFDKDLKNGEIGEMDMVRLMETFGMEFIHKTVGNDKRYDLLMSYEGNVCKYEIKTDTYPYNTGNIVIEFESRGVPSGIAVTESDYFTTFFPFWGEVWNIKTSDLKLLIERNKLPISENSGDKNSNTKLYRISKNKFKSYFKFYKLNQI